MQEAVLWGEERPLLLGCGRRGLAGVEGGLEPPFLHPPGQSSGRGLGKTDVSPRLPTGTLQRSPSLLLRL